MRGDLNFFAIVVVAVAVFASISIYVATATGETPDETEITAEDLVGHWYAAMEMTLTDDGYTKSTPAINPDIGVDDLDIRGYSGNVFHGSQFGIPLTGSFSNGILELATEYHGSASKYVGYVEDVNTFTVVNAHAQYNEDGTISETCCRLLTFTKDPSRTLAEVPGYMDVTGDWKLADDTFLRDGAYGSYGYGNLKIDIQHDNLFQGEFDIGDVDSRDLKGVMYKYGDMYRGIAISAVGVTPIINITADGVLTATTVNGNADAGYSYASCATFTRDGNASFEESGLVGTSWSVRDYDSIDGDGLTTKNVKLYSLHFEEEKNGVIRGTWRYGAEEAGLSGYTHRDSNGLFVNIGWCEDDRIGISKIGYLRDNGSMIISTSYVDDDGLSTTRSYVLEAVVGTDEDIVGHWYMSRTVGFDKDFFDYTMYNTPHIGMLDFDIYDVRDGQVHAWYMNGNIVASYLDGLLYCENARVEGVVEYIYGWLESDGTMTCMITHEGLLPDGTLETGVSYATFTKDRGPVTSLDTSVDITGDWTAIDPISMDVDGNIYAMNGTRIIIDRELSGVFTGTMEQMVDNHIVSLGIKGVIVMTTWGTVQGRIIDADGLLWNIQFADGCLMLNAVDISPVAAIKGELDTVERRYIPTGTPDPGFEYLKDITGRTWSGDTQYVTDDYGNHRATEVDFKFTITHQHNNLLSGTCIEPYTGEEVEWVAYLVNSVGQPMFEVLIDSPEHGEANHGLAWTYNGNTYLMVVYSENGRGVVSTIQLTEVLPQ